MTTPHRTLQMALDALDAITDDVDGTGLNTMPSFDKAIDAIAALREALAAPEPEPVALESVHLTRDTRGMCVVRVNGRLAIRDNGDIIDHMATLEWFAAPPAAPAPVVPVVPLTEAAQDYDWMPEARVSAAQCWCDPETSHTVMDPALAEAVARRIAAWMQTGAFHARNEAYWRDRCKAAEAHHGITGGKP